MVTGYSEASYRKHSWSTSVPGGMIIKILGVFRHAFEALQIPEFFKFVTADMQRSGEQESLHAYGPSEVHEDR